MYLYICEGYKSRGTTEELVKLALQSYADETGADFSGSSCEILRGPKGKPYFEDIPVSFSVSHTGNLWVCLMAEGPDPVGVDIQLSRDYSFEKIADRYYTAAEQQYCAENGPAGFFEIWTKKEAYAKFTGEGLGKYLADIDTINNSEVIFTEIKAADGIDGACCTRKKGKLWIRRI